MSGIPAGAGQLLGKRLGKFEILALLALGGTAEIYLARIGGAAGFEKYVVVKCLHDHLADDVEFVKMFLDEARLAAHLDHSNIVQTMELGEHEGRYYMVMEFLAGLSLAMIVRRVTERMPTGRIPAPLVLNILAQAAAGLHYAHEKAMNGKALNIVHRDISPQNLVISFEGVVKLVDFGIAKAELRETRTRSGTIKGKFAYMSPEQCVANNVDRRTDVFALGVIGHELLTGRRLFKRPSPYETYQAVMECDVKPPSTADPEIDRALDEVIMRAITKDRADRYPSAEAFGDALLGYLHHRGIGSGPGDVSRFFDAQFGQEIDEHSGRMRELIAGREVSGDSGMSWGSNDAGRDSDSGLAELAAASSGALTASRQSVGSLSFVLDGLGVGSRGEADDEMPAERTRIEANPLERFNELERLAARPGGGNPDGPTQLAPSSAVPMPAPPPMEAARAAGAGPQPQPRPQAGQASRPAQSHAAQPPPEQAHSSGAPGTPSSGRFPDLANLPTMIAGAVPPSMVTGTERPTLIPGADPPTGETSPLPSLAGGGPPGALPAHARTQIVSLPAAGTPASGAHSGNGALAGMPGAQGSPIGASPAQGYPVMNAALRDQIATGATVFPSGVQRGGPPPGGGMPGSGSGPGMPGPGMPGPGMPGPGMSGRGMPQDASGPSMSPGPGGARGPDSGALQAGYPMQGGAMFDPQRAAEMMSPVGQHYPENVDWSSAAAGRARAVRPWLLVTLFIGAIGIALLLTIVVARLMR